MRLSGWQILLPPEGVSDMRERLVKVVRDKIPQYLPEDEVGVQYKPIVDRDKFEDELRKKLGEEVAEYLVSGDITELADVVAVAEAIALHLHGYSRQQLQKFVEEKFASHGGFKDMLGMYVMTLEEGEQS